jgi:hypothetical protein
MPGVEFAYMAFILRVSIKPAITIAASVHHFTSDVLTHELVGFRSIRIAFIGRV